MSATLDVVIVGGGPAGAAAALALARAGRTVALFERAAMPRDKVCGDLLGTDAVKLVRRLGFSVRVLARATSIDGAVLHVPSGRSYGTVASQRETTGAGVRACVIARRDLDTALVLDAERAGASVRTAHVVGVERTDGRVVGVRTARETIAARVVIGADGWGSVVARALDIEAPEARNVAVAVRAYAHGVRDLGSRMHFFINAAGDGYGWAFPTGESTANVGLGYVRGEGELDVRAAWTRFVGTASLAAPYLRDAEIGTPSTWPIPIGPRRIGITPGALLAGDAAWLASPISGSGIASALASGDAAARFALRALAGDETAWSGYATWLQRRIVARLHAEAWVHATIATPQAVERYTVLGRIPGAQAILSRAMLALG